VSREIHRSPSLQKLLERRLAASLVGFWLLAVGLAAFLAYQQFNQAFDSALQETGQRILPLAILEIFNRDTGNLSSQSLPALNIHDEYLTYRVMDHQGTVLLQSHAIQPDTFPQEVPPGFSSTASHRLYMTSAVSGRYSIQVAEPLNERRQLLFKTLATLLLPLVLLLPASLLGIGFWVRRGLAPLKAYRNQLQARTPGHLEPLDIQLLPGEIQPMGETINHLLERLSRALTAERNFTANAAHELRTPLAVALAQVQRLHQQVKTPDLQTRCEQLESSLKQLSRLAEKLLELATAEGAGLLAEKPSDLLPRIEFLVQEKARQYPGRLHLHLPEQPLYSSLDTEALALLLNNLLDNALKYSPSGSPVEVALNPEGRLQVINACETLSLENLQNLHQPFIRYCSDVAGSGLGLALVTAILEGVGEKLELKSPATGRNSGFEASCQLRINHYANTGNTE